MNNISQPKHKRPPILRGLKYYVMGKLFGRPRLINLEFTKRCNARCSFCTCWQVDSRGELEDYAPIIKKFRPIVCSVSGGEPLLRKNFKELLTNLRPYCHYLVVITNGALLDLAKARDLVAAGVNQLSISLDYLSAQHDEARGIPNLYAHLEKLIPELTANGIPVTLNTIIMESNLDEIVQIAHRAKEWGAKISFSAYCALKSDRGEDMIRDARLKKLSGVIDELLSLKRTLKNIKNSDYYLKGIPKYFRDGMMPGCKAGFRWFQVTPDGYIQQCSELPRVCHYTEFSRDKIKSVTCAKCWYTCRGEAEMKSFQPRRILELIRS